MTEINGVEFESAKVIPAGAKLVFKFPPQTTDMNMRQGVKALRRAFSSHEIVVLRDCELHAVIDGTAFYAGETPTDSHEVPGFTVIDLGGACG